MSNDKPLISSVRVEEGPRHDRVTVWNRGANCGTLTVDHGDGNRIMARLMLDHRPALGDEDGGTE